MTKTSTWICPTLCGCALTVTYTFRVSAARAARLSPLMLRQITESQQFDEVGTTREILAQCAEHAALPTVQALWDELQHLHGTVHRPDTCGCTLASWWDDRIPQDQRGQVAVDHPLHTVRCEHHQLADPVDHADIVLAENRHKNLLVNQIADDTGQPPEAIAWGFDARRGLTIPGVPEPVVRSAETKIASHPLVRATPVLAQRLTRSVQRP